MTNNSEMLDIIRKHQIKAPIRVLPIAEELGIKVFYVLDWPDACSGKLARYKDAKSGFAIYVNKNHSERRRRFTIAHEIGHFILHRTLIKDEIFDDALYRSGFSNAVEASANHMAADILMPWHLLRPCLLQDGVTVEALAKKFNVSQTAMAIRLDAPNGT